jgi:hypothetical protein
LGALLRGPPSLAKPRPQAEQFRSPEKTTDDNWDDDFASAISPRALQLQLPHLKPQDNFGGLLSSEKLKSFASFEAVTEEGNWGDHLEGDLTVRSPMHLVDVDPLQTVRPFYPSRASPNDIRHDVPTKSPKRRQHAPPRDQKGRSSMQPTAVRVEPSNLLRSASHYQEDSVEDYSDLVLANDGAFEQPLALPKVSY